jgi:hypothetical protein
MTLVSLAVQNHFEEVRDGVDGLDLLSSPEAMKEERVPLFLI